AARGAAGSGADRRGRRPRGGGGPPPTPGGRRRPRSLAQCAAPLGPERLDLRDDPRPELVAGTGERVGGVGVQALQAAAPARAGDAEVERGAAVPSLLPAGELAAHAALLLVGGGEARRELRLGAHGLAPALDPSRRLEPRHGGDEVAAREVVRRRERLAAGRVRALRDRRRAERTTDDDAAERTRLPPELARDEGPISVRGHGARDHACAATAGCP